MGLSEKMRRLIEKNTGFTIPLEAGDPASSLSVGVVLDISSDKRPTIGHLASAPFGVEVGPSSPTGVLDVDLSLSKLLTANANLDSTVDPDTAVEAGLKLKFRRDVVLSIDPAKGERLDGLLSISSALVKHPKWNHAKFAFVFRTYAVKSARMHMAKKGDGAIALKGNAKAVSNAISGHFDAGVTWETHNVITETINEPGVLGVHCARVLKNGALKFV